MYDSLTIVKCISSLHPLLQSIQHKICTNYDDTFSWTQGGCFAFAEAITRVLKNSKLCVVAQYDKKDGLWCPNHAVIQYNKIYFDTEGMQTKTCLLERYCLPYPEFSEPRIGQVKDWEDLWYPEQEFVTAKEIYQLGQQFLNFLHRNTNGNSKRLVC